MNDTNGKAKSQPKRRPSVGWFSIERYAWPETLLKSDPLLLYQEFRLRSDAYANPELRDRMLPVIQQGDGRLTTYIAPTSTAQIDPPADTAELDALLRAENSQPFLFGTPAVSALTCRDMAILNQQAAPNAIPPPNEYSKPGRSEAQIGGPFSGQQQVMYIRDKLSIDSHRYSRHPDAGEAEYAMHCKIDLDYTDAAILKSLKLALPLWRKSMKQLTGKYLLSEKQSDVELAKIVTYNLLPVMDLELWMKGQDGIKLSQFEIVKLLDPSLSTPVERYRKTAKKELKKFMTPEWHRKLYAAAYARQMKQLKN